MTHLDLFSGIGGFALAASWVWPEHKVVAFCESDRYCRQVLKKHWPDVPIIEDVKDVENEYGPVDLLTGGFPCQDISSANRAAEGIEGPKSVLWYDMLRVARITKPRWIIVENVKELRTRGLDKVLIGLAGIGYNAVWQTISATTVGAPHMRKRIFLVAHPDGFSGLQAHSFKNAFREKQRTWSATHSKNWREMAQPGWQIHPSWIIGNINGVPDRVDRCRSIGNSVVPEVVANIMKAMKAVDES